MLDIVIYILEPRAWALLGASGDQTAQVFLSPQIPCCWAKRWQSFLMLFLSLLMVFFSSIFYLLLSISFFISSRNLLGPILNSQADPPTLKNLRNLDMFETSTFSIQRLFGKRFGALSGSFWKLLGGLVGTLFLGPLRILFLLFLL